MAETKDYAHAEPLNRSVYLAAAAVAALVLVLYLIFPSSNYNGDGLGIYASLVERASTQQLWSVSARLLFVPTGKLIQSSLALVGLHVRSVYVLQTFNSVAGALAVGVFFLLAYRISRKRSLSAIVAGGLAVSLGFWFWCVDCTSYPANVLFLICTLYMLVRMLDASNIRSYLVAAALVGIFHALACLYWFTGVLLAPSIFLAVMIAGRSMFNWRNRILAGVTYGVSSAVVLFAPLLVAARKAGGITSLSEFPGWLTSASHSIPPALSAGNFFRGIIGFSSGIFRMTELGPYIKRAIWHVPFLLESRVQLLLEASAFVLLWLIVLGAVLYLYRARKQLIGEKARLVLTLILWAAPVASFGLVWLGSDTERWLALTPVFWVFLLLVGWHAHKFLAPRKARIISYGLGAFVGLILLHNAAIAIIPDSRPENNHAMQVATALDQHMTKNDLAMLWGYDNIFTGAHLFYFFDKRSVHLRMQAWAMRENIDSGLTATVDRVFAHNGRVFVIGRMFLDKDVPESRYSEDDQTVSRKELGAVLSKWPREEAFTIGKDTFWRLEPLEVIGSGAQP